MTDADDSPSTWPTRLAEYDAEPVSPRRAAAHRLAAAVRNLIGRVVLTPADETTLTAAADDIERVLESLPPGDGGSVHRGGMVEGDEDHHGFVDGSPLFGHSNPLAPPVSIEIDGDSVIGSVTFGAAYEGPPGCVHGGFIAAAFDEVLGTAQTLSGQPGMTGELVVRYRSPTPLHEELRFVGRFDGVDGRKIRTSGTLHAGDRLCAEATGLFITVDFSRFSELRAQEG